MSAPSSSREASTDEAPLPDDVYENHAYLEGVVRHMEEAHLPSDHRQFLTKFPHSVRSTKMVKFFRKNGLADSAEDAILLGQRLYDATLIIPCVPKRKAHRFKNTKKLYYIVRAKPDPLVKAFNKGVVFQIASRDDVVEGPLDVQGVLPSRNYAVLLKRDKLMYLFRRKGDKKPYNVLHFDQPGLLFHISTTTAVALRHHQGSSSASASAQAGRTTSNVLSVPAGPAPRHKKRSSLFERQGSDSASVSGDDGDGDSDDDDDDVVDPLAEAKEGRLSPHIELRRSGTLKPAKAFLHVVLPTRMTKFRLNTRADRDKWAAALDEMGVERLPPEDVRDTLDEEAVLDMHDVLVTPAFRSEFLEFLKEHWALENVKFLEAIEGYRQLTDNVERKQAAQRIFKSFIVESADEMVNLDAVTLKDLKEGYGQNIFRKRLFDQAYKVVYRMIERDVYQRFVQSERYHMMIATAQEQQRRPSLHARSTPPPASAASQKKQQREKEEAAVARPGKLRKDESFYIASLDDTKELTTIVGEAKKATNLVQDRRHHLRKYAKSFQGAQLVDWLMLAGYAHIRPAAEAIGQRLVDAGMLRHVSEPYDFADCEELYTFELLKELEKQPSCEELLSKLAKSEKPEAWGCAKMLLKGSVKYNRCFVVCVPAKHRLTVFRSKKSAHPFLVLSSKHVTFEHRQDTAADALFGGAPACEEERAATHSRASSLAAVAEDEVARGILYCFVEGNVFRVEDRRSQDEILRLLDGPRGAAAAAE